MKYIYKLEEIFTVILMVIIFAVLLSHVLGRYVFGHPFVFAEELTRYCFIWTVMVCAAVGIRRNSHTTVTYFVEFLPDKAQQILDIIRNIIIGFFLVVVVYYGFFLASKTMNVPTAAMRWPWGMIYASAPIGSILMIIHIIENIVKDVRVLKNPELMKAKS